MGAGASVRKYHSGKNHSENSITIRENSSKIENQPIVEQRSHYLTICGCNLTKKASPCNKAGSLKTKTNTNLEEMDFAKFDEAIEANRLKKIRSSNFDVWECETEELIIYVISMFRDLEIVNELEISYSKLRDWLVAVELNYSSVYFHNFRHAFCVTQMMYFMIHELNLVKQMTRLQLGIILVACICHDLDHPGLTNLYQKKAHTELSVLYNDASPLEHHHCAVAFQILSVEELNIFSSLSKTKFAEMSHIVIQLILATDMAIHDTILADFKDIIKEGFTFSKPVHMMALQKILIKCCDISNEVRPLDFSELWADRLFEEFFSQADRERREGLPVARFMDPSKVHKARDQLKFIRDIIMPLFMCLGKVLPDVKTKILKSLKESECYYEQMTYLEQDNSEGIKCDAPAKPDLNVPYILINNQSLNG